MKKVFLGLVLIVVFVCFYYIYSSRNNFSSVIINGHEIKIEIMDTPAKQAQGLSGHESLAENSGMLFVFSKPARQNFWMKDMKFPIDIIWIRQTADGDRIVGFVENAPVPPSTDGLETSLEIFSSPDNVYKVLEINAGLVKRWGIKVGDLVD